MENRVISAYVEALEQAGLAIKIPFWVVKNGRYPSPGSRFSFARNA